MIKKSIRKNENYNTMFTLLACSADVTNGGGTCFSMDSFRGQGVAERGAGGWRDKQAIEHTCIYMDSVSCRRVRQFLTGCLAN